MTSSIQILNDYEKKIVAFTSEDIRVYNVEFPAPDLREGFDRIPAGETAPSWRGATTGLNIEYSCANCGKKPIIMKGLGTFEAVAASHGHDCIVPNCGQRLLVSKVNCYWLSWCTFSWYGILSETEEEVRGSDRFTDLLGRTNGNAVKYMKLDLTTTVIPRSRRDIEVTTGRKS